jgi:hypothetical protein
VQIAWHTPPELAAEYRVDPAKIRALIESGELIAVNLAASTSSRPRYRISPAAKAAFEASRSAGPQPKITRCRRRRDPSVIEFF